MPLLVRAVIGGCLLFLILAGCGSTALSPQGDGGQPAGDAAVACIASAARTDAAPYVDPACGCPTGTVCVGEMGGVAGGGGAYCSPIPEACHGVPSCACMETCACAYFSFRNLSCSDAPSGQLECDDGIR